VRNVIIAAPEVHRERLFDDRDGPSPDFAKEGFS
jgi:hypothetical protein